MTTTLERQPLTDRQREVLAWISDFIAEHGFSPSVREICDAFGWDTPNSAMCHLKPLRRKGHVTWVDGSPRTLRVVEVAK